MRFLYAFGFPKAWHRRIMPKEYCNLRNAKTPNPFFKTKGEQHRPLTLKDLTGAFLILGIGLSFGFLVFLLEKIVSIWKDNTQMISVEPEILATNDAEDSVPQDELLPAIKKVEPVATTMVVEDIASIGSIPPVTTLNEDDITTSVLIHVEPVATVLNVEDAFIIKASLSLDVSCDEDDLVNTIVAKNDDKAIFNGTVIENNAGILKPISKTVDDDIKINVEPVSTMDNTLTASPLTIINPPTLNTPTLSVETIKVVESNAEIILLPKSNSEMTCTKSIDHLKTPVVQQDLEHKIKPNVANI